MTPSHPRTSVLSCLATAWVAILATAAGGHLEAQSPEREPAVVQLAASARAAGLGGAFQVGASDSDVVFHHPGLAGNAAGFMLGYQRYGDAASGLSLSAGTSWFGGSVAVGVRTLEYASSSPGSRPGGVDPILAGGDVGVGEMTASIVYAREVGPVQVGVGGTLVNQRYGDARESRGALDVGMARDLGRLQLALSARNLGPDYVIDGVEVSQPEEVTLGIGGYGQPLGPLDVGLAGTLTRRADGEWTGGGGVELGYWPVRGRTFVVRIGGRHVPEGDASPVTFGGSFWGDDLVLEYAFEPVQDQDGIHRVSLGWR